MKRTLSNKREFFLVTLMMLGFSLGLATSSNAKDDREKVGFLVKTSDEDAKLLRGAARVWFYGNPNRHYLPFIQAPESVVEEVLIVPTFDNRSKPYSNDPVFLGRDGSVYAMATLPRYGFEQEKVGFYKFAEIAFDEEKSVQELGCKVDGQFFDTVKVRHAIERVPMYSMDFAPHLIVQFHFMGAPDHILPLVDARDPEIVPDFLLEGDYAGECDMKSIKAILEKK